MVPRADPNIIPDMTTADVWFTLLLHQSARCEHFDNIIVNRSDGSTGIALRYAELPSFVQRYVDEHYVHTSDEWRTKQGWQRMMLPGKEDATWIPPCSAASP
jgi:hypothetical protein